MLDSTIKLEKGAYVELTGPGTKLSLSQPGTYQLRAIMAKRQGMDSTGLGKSVDRYINTLSNGPAENASTIAGVRGAEQGQSNGSEWVTSDTAIYLDAAKAYIAAGSWDLAIGQLKEGLVVASADEMPELKFYLAEASALAGKTREAFKWMGGVQVSGSEPWAADFWMLEAKLLIDTMAYQQAVDLLTGPAKSVATIAQRETLYRFLLAAAYSGTGDTASERAELQKLAAMSGTEAGKTAAALLAGETK
jgi:hypothetical protein